MAGRQYNTIRIEGEGERVTMKVTTPVYLDLPRPRDIEKREADGTRMEARRRARTTDIRSASTQTCLAAPSGVVPASC
jgi:hypothetical protein